MSCQNRGQQQRPGGLNSRLSRILFRLLLCVASAQGSFPSSLTPRSEECLTYQSVNSSSVVCFSPATFPSLLPNDTTLLAVEFSNLTQLPAEALRGVPCLRELHLSSNRLEELPAKLLAPVPGLKVLDLTHNAVTQLPRASSGARLPWTLWC